MRRRQRGLVGCLLVWTLVACALLPGPSTSSASTNSLVLDPSNPQASSNCSSLGGTWEGVACYIDSSATISQGEALTISGGGQLVVPTGAVLNDSGTVTIQNGVLSVSGTVDIPTAGILTAKGTLANGVGGTITVAGILNATVTAGGQVYNQGTMENLRSGSVLLWSVGGSGYQGAFFVNNGTLRNEGLFQTFANFTSGVQGIIENSGMLVLASSTTNNGGFTAPFDLSQGSFTNLASGQVLIQGATFNNTGAFTNAGSFVDKPGVYGVVNNEGTFLNQGLLNNSAFFVNAEGNFTNYGTLLNLQGCAIQTCGTVSNTGVFVNERGGVVNNAGNLGDSNPEMTDNPRHFNPVLGTFQNYGVVNNLQLFLNAAGGTFENYGNLSNTGTLRNVWNVTNLGGLYSSGTIVNQANLTNLSSGTFVNEKLISNSGTILNTGTWYDACGGSTIGNGTLAGKPLVVSDACPTIPVQAPEFPLAWAPAVTLGLVVAVSAAIARTRQEHSSFGAGERGTRIHVRSPHKIQTSGARASVLRL